MVRLNKNQLDAEQLKKILNQLASTIGETKKSEAKIILDTLLGEEEKIMIAKRLGVIVLLEQGHKPYTISRALKMSPTTVGKIQSGYTAGEYNTLFTAVKKNHLNYKEILKAVDSILTVGGIMPRYGQQSSKLR
jgi:uncharacterized protein YerC